MTTKWQIDKLFPYYIISLELYDELSNVHLLPGSLCLGKQQHICLLAVYNLISENS